MEKKQVTLKEYIESHGYTIEEWTQCADMLCKKGVGNGCYDDYNLLTLVMSWLYNFKSEMEVE